MLSELLKSYGKLAIAFSGGVDSSTLLAYSVKVLGKENVLPLICSSAFSIKRVEDTAKEVAKELNIRLHIVNINPFLYANIIENGADRCYYCKQLIFSTLQTYANDLGFLTLADGSNFDDDDAGRPGAKAARELCVISPLKGAEFTKEMVRSLAHDLGLKNSRMSANSCLATRIKSGEVITEQVLKMVEKSENEILESYGFARLRVKYLVDKVVVEISKHDSEQLHENSEAIIEIIKGVFEDVLVEIATV